MALINYKCEHCGNEIDCGVGHRPDCPLSPEKPFVSLTNPNSIRQRPPPTRLEEVTLSPIENNSGGPSPKVLVKQRELCERSIFKIPPESWAKEYLGTWETENGMTKEWRKGDEYSNVDVYYRGDLVMRIIEHYRLPFTIGNVVKYIARAGVKTPDKVSDYKDAQWYLNREITHGPEIKTWNTPFDQHGAEMLRELKGYNQIDHAAYVIIIQAITEPYNLPYLLELLNELIEREEKSEDVTKPA